MFNLLKIILKELRPHQWVKNLLIFLPIITSHQISIATITNSLLGFLAFCVSASSIYILNDILDIQDDRNDSLKKHRPIASGELSILSAVTVMVVLISLVIGIGIFIPPNAIYVLIFYYLVTIGYSLKLKRMPIVDIYILSMLYSVRVFMGQAMTNITISAWLIVFCMFFFLSLACLKRVSELYRVQNHNQPLAKRRGYATEDLKILMPTGICCALIAVLVVGLYINSDQVKSLYAHPDRIWFIVFVLLFWKIRLWFLGGRGLINQDPILFVIKDKTTYFIFSLIAITGILAK